MVALSSMTISLWHHVFFCGDRLFTKTFEEMLLVPVHPLALHIGKMLMESCGVDDLWFCYPSGVLLL